MQNIDVNPNGLRRINIYYGKEKPVTTNFPLFKAKKDYRIGLMAGYFDPLHPVHLILAAESIIKGLNDKVIFLPLDISQRKPNATPFLQRYESLEKTLSSFSPWFQLSDQKRNRTNPDAVAALRGDYQPEIHLNWIASSAGKSGLEIFNLLNKGYDIKNALAEVISPHISRYIYFYSQRTEIVEAFQSCPQVKLIGIPDKYKSLLFIHSTLLREGLLNWTFSRNDRQININIEQDFIHNE
jgi:hypothetical protein